MAAAGSPSQLHFMTDPGLDSPHEAAPSFLILQKILRDDDVTWVWGLFYYYYFIFTAPSQPFLADNPK